MMKRAKIYQQLGQRIRALRQQRGLSQEKLALEAGLHRTYIGDIEAANKRVSLEKLEQIAKALDVSLCELFQFNRLNRSLY
jgi:transcriptional regulator with XRE-family HTH domain